MARSTDQIDVIHDAAMRLLFAAAGLDFNTEGETFEHELEALGWQPWHNTAQVLEVASEVAARLAKELK